MFSLDLKHIITKQERPLFFNFFGVIGFSHIYSFFPDSTLYMSHFDIGPFMVFLLSCPVQLWSPAIRSPLARDIDRQLASLGS